MNTKSHPQFIALFIFFASTNVIAEESIFEKNIEVQNKNAEIDSSLIEKNISKSSFYPELNITTGIGSEYTKDKAEAEKGGTLYLDSKINLYSGGKDLTNLNINESKISKAKTEKILSIQKVQIEVNKLVSERNSLIGENKLLKLEIESNQKQSTWAKKKVDAGLTTNVELLDFQIKETALFNEIAINDLKIKDNETELLNLFGNALKIEEILAQLTKNTPKAFYDLKNDTTLNEKILTEELKISDLELQKSKKNYFPKIDFEAKAGNITPTSKLLNDKTEHQIALTLTLPLFNGFSTQSDIQKAANNKFMREKNLKNYQANLNSIIETEKRKIELNKKLLKTQEENLLRAIKFYEQTINEYKRGIKNSSDLISSSDRVLEFNIKINDLKNEIEILTYNFNLNYSM